MLLSWRLTTLTDTRPCAITLDAYIRPSKANANLNFIFPSPFRPPHLSPRAARGLPSTGDTRANPATLPATCRCSSPSAPESRTPEHLSILSWRDSFVPFVSVGTVLTSLLIDHPCVVAISGKRPDDLVENPLLVMTAVDTAVLMNDVQRFLGG